jgi:hypothetical protein
MINKTAVIDIKKKLFDSVGKFLQYQVEKFFCLCYIYSGLFFHPTGKENFPSEKFLIEKLYSIIIQAHIANYHFENSLYRDCTEELCLVSDTRCFSVFVFLCNAVVGVRCGTNQKCTSFFTRSST